MDEEKVPVVFVSYCWTNETHKEWVLNLANRLMNKSGVEVILDRWHGVVGHDRFKFMEDSIKQADKVLVICDEMYCRKANNRAGGVGTETLIITPEVYQNTKQEKFIPIAINKDSNGNFLLPTYISSRFALGMTDPNNFERDYSELERLIWEEPQLRPPVRGPKPDFQNQIVTAEPQEKNPTLKTDNTHEERVVWLLPRGFLLFENITFNRSESWVTRAHYYNYDGECQLGIHFHESYSDAWDKNPEIQFRKLRIPKADWEWCDLPLYYLEWFRLVDAPIDIKHKVSQLQLDYPVYYYAPWEDIPLPKVPEEYSFYYETGDLRDLIEDIRSLAKNEHKVEDYHERAISIRHSAYLFSLKFLGQDNPSLSFIKEIIDKYDSSFGKILMQDWLKRLDTILTSTLNHERETWQAEFKRSKDESPAR
ncbi:SEFIR domain-containing protein [Paenibacillus sp. VCA1]|uniref:SEFIR domain-containing protein n=1 Tax=Paenibacillus sp. VCA1 TaxID=3039148 RepID=UPI002870F0E0|nr:SEFIR domain-containing protein [Paenibacillus sp. VCA1]MDR9855631.1 SEFIR domain-containing protein [Paenibacillus sp. VCA1]